MPHYLFNLIGDRRVAEERLAAGRWPVDDGERHRGALAAGDLVLIYLGAPARELLGRAELASAVHAATGDVRLTAVERWDPPVPMTAVLARIDTSAGARADFDTGVLRITPAEYDAALTVAATR